MSKKNRKNKKGNQSTTQVTAPVVTREEAEVIEAIITEVTEDGVIDVDSKELPVISVDGTRKKITKAKKNKKSSKGESKSLLEKIGMEDIMSKAPEFSSKEEILAGNQGIIEKEIVAEATTEDMDAMVILNTLYIAINANLIKHGLVNKVSLEDIMKIIDIDTNDVNTIAINIIKSIDFSNFDGKFTELVMELKFTLLSWLESNIIPLMQKDNANITEVKEFAEKLKGITEENYNAVLSSLGINFDFNSLVTPYIEEKLVGNQGAVEIEKETETNSVRNLYNSVNNILEKYGVVNKIKFEDISVETKSSIKIVNKIIKSIDFSNFDGKFTELVMELKYTLISWAYGFSPILKKVGTKRTIESFNDILSNVNKITESNYKGIIVNMGIDISPLTKNKKKKIETDTRKFVHEYGSNEKLSKDTEIMSLGWYIFNGLGSDKYEKDRVRL